MCCTYSSPLFGNKENLVLRVISFSKVLSTVDTNSNNGMNNEVRWVLIPHILFSFLSAGKITHNSKSLSKVQNPV